MTCGISCCAAVAAAGDGSLSADLPIGEAARRHAAAYRETRRRLATLGWPAREAAAR